MRGSAGPLALRPAVASDAGPVLACLEAAYAPVATGLADLPDMSEGLEDDITAGRVWVVAGKAGIDGVLVLVTTGDEAKIANVAVHPGAQGTGLGGRLMRAAERMARENDCNVLRLATHRDMPGNIALYRHLGWTETGRDGVRVFFAKALAG